MRVDRLAPTLFKLGGSVGLPPKDETIIRYFITTGSALRRFVRDRESEFDPKLLPDNHDAALAPVRVDSRVRDGSCNGQYGQIAARAVIDATASLRRSYAALAVPQPHASAWFLIVRR